MMMQDGQTVGKRELGAEAARWNGGERRLPAALTGTRLSRWPVPKARVRRKIAAGFDARPSYNERRAECQDFPPG